MSVGMHSMLESFLRQKGIISCLQHAFASHVYVNDMSVAAVFAFHKTHSVKHTYKRVLGEVSGRRKIPRVMSEGALFSQSFSRHVNFAHTLEACAACFGFSTRPLQSTLVELSFSDLHSLIVE